jgi:hypothetical protein
MAAGVCTTGEASTPSITAEECPGFGAVDGRRRHRPYKTDKKCIPVTDVAHPVPVRCFDFASRLLGARCESEIVVKALVPTSVLDV